jgi:hypothetical protein
MARWPAEIPLRSRCFGGSRLRPPYHKPPSSLTQLAVAAGQQACVDLIWRRGSKGLQRGRFLAVRVRPAGVTPRRRARQDGGELPVRWLLVEWPTGQATPVKYWLSNLPQTSPLVELVGLARSRCEWSRITASSKVRSGWTTSRGAAGSAGTTT